MKETFTCTKCHVTSSVFLVELVEDVDKQLISIEKEKRADDKKNREKRNLFQELYDGKLLAETEINNNLPFKWKFMSDESRKNYVDVFLREKYPQLSGRVWVNCGPTFVSIYTREVLLAPYWMPFVYTYHQQDTHYIQCPTCNEKHYWRDEDYAAEVLKGIPDET